MEKANVARKNGSSFIVILSEVKDLGAGRCYPTKPRDSSFPSE